MDEIRILSPTAILGYGFPESSFQAGLERRPHLIAVDAGSTDPGPYYLGAGVSFTDRQAVQRDLRHMIVAGRRLGIPVVIGSAGGAGAHPHVSWAREIIQQIADEEGLRFRLAVIHADVPKTTLLAGLDAGELGPLPPGPEATVDDVVESTHVVGQMGVEPIVRALDLGADVILTGRAYDPAVFAALPIRHGFDPGLALHLGKILECAAIAATPGSGSDCMLGVLRRDHFLVEPLNPDRACTVTSVAAHTLYEKTNPYRLPGPGGLLDLTANDVRTAHRPRGPGRRLRVRARRRLHGEDRGRPARRVPHGVHRRRPRPDLHRAGRRDRRGRPRPGRRQLRAHPRRGLPAAVPPVRQERRDGTAGTGAGARPRAGHRDRSRRRHAGAGQHHLRFRPLHDAAPRLPRPDLHRRQPRLPVLPVGLQGRRGLPLQPLPPAPGRRSGRAVPHRHRRVTGQPETADLAMPAEAVS